MKRVKKADGGMMTAQVIPSTGSTGMVSTQPVSTGGTGSFGGTSLRNAPLGSTGGTSLGGAGSPPPLGREGGPNAPAGRGYNREGFRGRGPMGMRPGGDSGSTGGSIPVTGGPGPLPAITGGPAPMTGGPLPTTQSGLMTAMGTPRTAFKKGGMASKGKSTGTMISTKGQGRSTRTKPCKIC